MKEQRTQAFVAPRLIKMPAVCQMLALSRFSVERLCREGKLRKVIMGPASIAFVEAEIVAFINEKIAATENGEASSDAKRQLFLAGSRKAASASVARRRVIKGSAAP